MSSWPISLQQKLNTAAFQLQYGITSIRSENEVGPAKVRSRATDGVDVYTCSILLDYDEQATFETFYKTTLNNGVNVFQFDDPFTGSPVDFRFKSAPAITPIGGRTFQLTMSWEKMP